MKLVSQDFLSDEKLAEECAFYLTTRKNFVEKRCVGYHLAWTLDDDAFQLTAHAIEHQNADVLAFACGRIRQVHGVDVASLQLIGVKPAARGRALGVRMCEFIIKTTGLPLAAAHIQTPQGRDLWLRMLQHAKQMILYIGNAGEFYRIDSADAIARLKFDPFDGCDAAFVLDKNDMRRENGAIRTVTRRRRPVGVA